MRVRHGKMLSPNPGEETHESRKDNQLLCRDESGSATRMSGDRMACGNTRQIQKEDDYRGALSKVKGLDKSAGIPFRFPHYKLTPTVDMVFLLGGPVRGFLCLYGGPKFFFFGIIGQGSFDLGGVIFPRYSSFLSDMELGVVSMAFVAVLSAPAASRWRVYLANAPCSLHEIHLSALMRWVSTPNSCPRFAGLHFQACFSGFWLGSRYAGDVSPFSMAEVTNFGICSCSCKTVVLCGPLAIPHAVVFSSAGQWRAPRASVVRVCLFWALGLDGPTVRFGLPCGLVHIQVY
ncbi:hypothetical protein Acr_00g0068830 [Actinidia rufa]|uniref:Uncharacterized protein n=1 Tax=Actinidia rufa TaxID=165716 RepID=A0A7J0DSX3_9ERIC|nr:hypothetical protein Acr_00g0068830 [Actinidia rufa]